MLVRLEPGSIRGDLAMSLQSNVLHASDGLMQQKLKWNDSSKAMSFSIGTKPAFSTLMEREKLKTN